jgi:ribosomal protein S18 acetylase RimI-like enzyme
MSQGGSSGGKSTTKSKEEIVSKKDMRTTAAGQDKILRLRAAIFDDSGADRNVLLDFAPFAKYEKNGLDLVIEFRTGTKLGEEVSDWAFELVKKHMEEEYDNSGYGWDDYDKMDELNDQASRFLVVRERESKRPVAFVSFKFTLQGEIQDRMVGDPALLVYDLQVEEACQRKGLGKHLMQMCELIARKQRMTHVMLGVTKCNEAAVAFITTKLKGFVRDDSLMASADDETDDSLQTFNKVLDVKVLKAKEDETKKVMEVQALARAIAKMSSPTSAADPVDAPSAKAAEASIFAGSEADAVVKRL